VDPTSTLVCTVLQYTPSFQKDKAYIFFPKTTILNFDQVYRKDIDIYNTKSIFNWYYKYRYLFLKAWSNLNKFELGENLYGLSSGKE
jgi:hypothetical protein